MMHHRCSGSCHGTMVGGPCSCGLFYGHQTNSFSMLFSMPNSSHLPYDHQADDNYSLESSSVDCTLSLGTPSTRLNSDTSYNNQEKISRRSNSRMTNFCWDILQYKHSSTHQSSHKSSRGSCNSGNETLLSRRCANCDTTSTPLWRNGPKGPKSLCNACGIRFKKEEKRASTASGSSSGGAPAGAAIDVAQNSSWIHHHSSSQNQKTSYINSSKYGISEFNFIDDHHHHRDSSSDAAGIPYLSSWRLNVTDRPTGLVHEFTR